MHVHEMIRTHPHVQGHMNDGLDRCIDQCYDCAQTCISKSILACALACRGCGDECESSRVPGATVGVIDNIVWSLA